jgi:hypothetical protein
VKSNSFIAHAGAVALLLSSALCVSAGPHQADNSTSCVSKHSIGTRQKAAGIPGFAEVTLSLYRRGQPDLTVMKTSKDGRRHRGE